MEPQTCAFWQWIDHSASTPTAFVCFFVFVVFVYFVDMQYERNVLCDKLCNMVQRREHVHETRRHERKSAQASSGQRTRALAYCDRVHYCAQVSRAARMDDMTKAKGRIRFQLFCLLPRWVGTDQIFP